MSAAPGRPQASSHRSAQHEGVPETAAPGRFKPSSHHGAQREATPVSSPERLLTLDDAQSGQTLSRALLDDHGHVLMAVGAELTESTMESLRQRGVETAWVVDHIGGDLVTGDLATTLRRVYHQQRLARLFRDTQAHEQSSRLLRLVSRYRGIDPA